MDLRPGDGEGEVEDSGNESCVGVEKKLAPAHIAASFEAGVCSMLFALAVEVVGKVIN